MCETETHFMQVAWTGSRLPLPQRTGPLVPFSKIGHLEDRVQPQYLIGCSTAHETLFSVRWSGGGTKGLAALKK